MRHPFPAARLLATLTLALAVCAVAAGRAGAQVPPVMSYDGYVTDAEGRPLTTGRRDITFSLYVEATGGTPLWSERHEKVLVSGGTFNVILGRGTVPRPLDLPFDRSYFLAIRLGTDPELLPRQELLPGAYSFHAKTASAVVDSSIGTSKLQTLSVTDDKIKSVSWSKITGVNGTNHGVPAQVWSLKGNRVGDPSGQFLGTVDDAPLVFRTNNQLRMDIAPGGNIEAHAQFLARGPIISRTSENEGAFYLADHTSGLTRSDHGASIRLFSTNGSLELGDGVATIDAKLEVAGAGKFAGLEVAESRPNGYVAEFRNLSGSAEGHGIKVIAGDDASSNATNYVSFYNSANEMKGRIEGQTVSEFRNSTDWKAEYLGYLATGALAAGYSWKDWGQGFATWAVEYGVWVAKSIARENNIGVTYASGAGDYAEWLPRLRADEALAPGQVVGLFGGRVSRTTRGAEQIMVVSTNPIVLGNMPDPGQEHLYTKVAFLGQVPVAVLGPVERGDFLIPSGRGDGTAVAVAPNLMTAKEFPLVLGRAWESSTSPLRKLVNAAVGLHSGDLAPLLARTEAQVAALRAQLQARTASLATLDERVADLEARVESLAAAGSGLARPRQQARYISTAAAAVLQEPPAAMAGSAAPAVGRTTTPHSEP